MLHGRPGFLAAHRLFIAVNARAEIVFADLAERLDGVKVRDLTWFGVAEAGADMDADSMIWQRQRLGGAGAVAVRGDDGSSTASCSRTSCGRSRSSSGRG